MNKLLILLMVVSISILGCFCESTHNIKELNRIADCDSYREHKLFRCEFVCRQKLSQSAVAVATKQAGLSAVETTKNDLTDAGCRYDLVVLQCTALYENKADIDTCISQGKISRSGY